MQDTHLEILETFFTYMSKILDRRGTPSPKSLVFSPTTNGQSALELFSHGINTLHKFSTNKFPETPPAEVLLFDLENGTPLHLQVIMNFRAALKEFSLALKQCDDEVMSKKGEFITTLVMHTLVHCGQALRVQKQVIEN